MEIFPFGHPITDGHFGEFAFNFLVMTHHCSTSKHPSSVPGTHIVLLAHFSTWAAVELDVISPGKMPLLCYFQDPC